MTKKTLLNFAKMARRPAILLAALFLPAALVAETIVVFHTSDIHSWYFSRPAKWMKDNPERMIGGFPALASLVKKEEKPYILLDSGDLFQGTPEGWITKGEASAVLMNELGYSASVVGNHEYDYGEKSLIDNFVEKADFPLLGANVYFKKNGKLASYLKPYTVVKKAGKKIAVLGIAGSHTSHSTLPSNVKHLDFRDEAAEAKKWSEKIMKDEKPDVLICLFHNGLALANGILDISTRTFTDAEASVYPSLRLARTAPEIDVILGGHIHTGYLKGYWDEKSKTFITESYWGLTHVNRIELEFDDKSGKFLKAESRLLPLWTDETGLDDKTLEKLNKIRERTAEKMDVKIGEAESDITRRTTGNFYDSPIGNWMTDVTRDYARSDMAFQNTHGIRSDIWKGDITLRDIFQVMPFDNTLVKVTMTGKQVKKLITDNLCADYSKMQVSGLTVKFKTGENGKPDDVKIFRDSKPVDPDDKFSVVTNNYLTSGGSGGDAFAEGEKMENTMKPIRDILIESIRENSPLDAPETGRIEKF